MNTENKNTDKPNTETKKSETTKRELPNQHLADRQKGLVDEVGNKIEPDKKTGGDRIEEREKSTSKEVPNQYLADRQAGKVDEKGNKISKDSDKSTTQTPETKIPETKPTETKPTETKATGGDTKKEADKNESSDKTTNVDSKTTENTTTTGTKEGADTTKNSEGENKNETSENKENTPPSENGKENEEKKAQLIFKKQIFMEVVKGSTAEEKEKVTIPLEKFPRLCAVAKDIENLHKIIDCLNTRKAIIKEGDEDLSRFEQNERQLLLLKTDIELANVHTKIISKQRDTKDYFDKVVYPYIDEIDGEIEKLFLKANERAKKDATLASVLREIDTSLFADNWEHKFNYYIAIKNYLEPNKKPQIVPKQKPYKK